MRRCSATFAALSCIGLLHPAAVAQTSVETSTSATRTTASEATVDRERLEIEAPRSSNDLVRAAPGVFVVQHGGEGKGLQLFVRGIDAVHGSDFELTLEGIPLNEFSNVHGHGYVELSFVLPELVGSLAVTRGVSSIGQGNFATAGSADMGLNRGAEQSEIQLEIGTPRRARLMALSASDGVTGAEVMWDAGFGEGRESRRATLNSVRPLHRNARGSVDALVMLGASKFELPGLLRLEDLRSERVDFYDSYDVGNGESTRALVGLIARSRSSAWSTRVTPYIGGRTLSICENVTGALVSPGGDLREQAEASWIAGLRLDAVRRGTFGGRARLLGHLHRTQLVQSERSADSARDLSAAAQQAALGVAWNRFFGAVDIEAGVRGEVVDYTGHDTGGTNVVAAPRASARWFIGPATLSAAFGRGYRLPNMRDVADGEAKPVLATSAEIGARLFGDRWDIGLAGFALRTDREAFFDHVSGTTLELDAAQRLGVEGDVAWSPWDVFRVGLDATFVDARFVGNRARVPNVPRVVTHAFAIVRPLETLRFGVRGGLFALRPLAYGATASDTGSLGVTANWDVEPFEIGLAIDNPLALRLREGEVNYASDWRAAGGTGGSTPAVHTIAAPPFSARLNITYHFGEDS